MKNMLKITCLFLAFSIYNCIPTKGVETKDNADSKTSKQQFLKEMKEKGFSKGTIVTSKNTDCSYILNVEEFEDNLDPINLKEFFKSEIPEHVWVKFSSLRMPSRCNEARPVSITEITRRDKL